MYLGSLTFLGWLLLAGSAVGCCYLLYAGLATRGFAGRVPARPGRSPPASLLKPLCGEDPDLYANLVSFCRQDYPSWQIVFGVQDPADPAIAVVRRLIAEFPDADLKLVVEGGRAGDNLKVANLQNMLPAARHDLIVIADSDIRVSPDYLAAVTAPLLDPATGLVTCLYRGVPAAGIWSRLAALHVNHGFLPQVLVAERLGASGGCFGATIALGRDTLAAIGGFAAVADTLADDHALGAAVRRLGRKVVLSPYIVDDIIVEPGLDTLFRHELRWARTIRAIAPAGFLGSVVTQPMVLALAAVALGGQPVAAPVMLLAALACRGVMARMVDRALKLPPTPLWLLPGRDLLSFAVFVASFFTRKVAWRDRTFRVGRNGRLILDGDKPA
ncbi:MAG TPA: bacteriohopanetetrol glucosamine biosynthesis glycosyltransferase HpnI [Xanthobacteraceae bacterium]|nr:bacteriohopanetetrol glucosamine biosynthesis glycosyltransferase HpnI [Xanthobacteraceae bacterium]HXZ00042.1 bacteriohopanetetrol glucosamine biosynthesis glycosyltransferase HpnI [Stellaceae bacterium]